MFSTIKNQYIAGVMIGSRLGCLNVSKMLNEEKKCKSLYLLSIR
jgi:hypothetical protein